MAKNQEIGQQGELSAIEHLISKGYEILERNYRYSRAEIDVICKKDDRLVFVEVKTRSYTYYGEPADFVTSKKEELIMDAANAYMARINYAWKFRFDIIGIVMQEDTIMKIEHIEDAFFPGW